MDLARLADLWEENQEFLKQRLGQSDSTRFGARWILMRYVPVPKFNHVSMVRISADAVPDLLSECRFFFRREGLPGCCIMTTPATEPAVLSEYLQDLGFSTESNPVMVWDGRFVPAPVSDVSVRLTARSESGLLFSLIKQTFFPDSTVEQEYHLRSGVEISYEIGSLNYVAYIRGEPAGAGTLFCRGAMGGIYNMCTLPRFRGRGVARALVAKCLDDALGMGCSHVGLTPTRMGRPLYERLGFWELYQERYYYERFM